jgi:hypothetical protein
VIVVTGVGRSGTSLVALLYRELGFDPGGEWYPEWGAGLEDPSVVELNSAIIRALGVGIPLRDAPGWLQDLKLPMPPAVRTFFRSRFEVLPEILTRRPSVRWERFPATVARFAPDLVREAQAHSVVKDPRFCWTLPVWAASGASIDHVLVCLRNVDSMLRSWLRMGRLNRGSWTATKNAFIQATGMCLSAVTDYDLDHAFVQFPHFVDAPKSLYDAMRFPSRVSWKRFSEAFSQVTDRGRVHEWK